MGGFTLKFVDFLKSKLCAQDLCFTYISNHCGSIYNFMQLQAM